MNRPALVLLDKDTHELIKEFACLKDAVDEMGVASETVRDNIHGRKESFRFGYFMVKSEWLEKKS